MKFSAIVLVVVAAAAASSSVAMPADAAQGQNTPQPSCEFGFLEAPLPGLSDKAKPTVCEIRDLPQPFTTYANILINYFIAAIIAIGLIMIVIAGYMYMTAGGNATRAGTAKTMIVSALTGIVLALLAYTILATIGDQFFQEPVLPPPSPTPTP